MTQSQIQSFAFWSFTEDTFISRMHFVQLRDPPQALSLTPLYYLGQSEIILRKNPIGPR